MATYPVDIPALPPLASGVNDNPAPPIAQGDPLQGNHVTLAKDQFINRKRLADINPPLATQDEVVASKRRKHDVESANFVGGDVPAWALGLQQQMNGLQQQMNGLQQQMANMATRQQLTNMQTSIFRVIRQESQRSINRSRKSTFERIEMVIRLDDGQLPNQVHHNIWFPDDQNVLMLASAAEITPLLVFYGLDPNGLLSDRIIRLKDFLGVTQ